MVRVLNHHFSTKSVWKWGISDQKILENTWENNDSSSTGGRPRIFQPRPWKKIPGSWPVTGSRVACGDIPGSAMAMLKWTYFWLPVWRFLYLLVSWSTPQKRSTLVQSSAIMFTISDSHHCCWILVEVFVCYVCVFCFSYHFSRYRCHIIVDRYHRWLSVVEQWIYHVVAVYLFVVVEFCNFNAY